MNKEQFFTALGRIAGQAADRMHKVTPTQAWLAIESIQNPPAVEDVDFEETESSILDQVSTIRISSTLFENAVKDVLESAFVEETQEEFPAPVFDAGEVAPDQPEVSEDASEN